VRDGRAFIAAILLSATTLAGCAQQSQAVQPHPTPVVAQAPVHLPALGDGVTNIQLFVLPNDSKRLLTRPIRAARRSIDLTMYLLTDHTLIHDLEYAHAKGIRVRVILEHHPFSNDVSGVGANQSAYDQLYAANIPVHWASPRFRLTHEKSMVIDNTTAYILTLNFTRSAFKKNREFGVIDNGSSDVREVAAIFAADWRDQPFTPHDPNLLVSPVTSRGDLLALIGRARHSLGVYAEEVQDRGIEAALVAASHRGVRVRLISNAADATNTRGLAVLRAGGVGIRLLHSPYIHAKAVIADNRWAFVGSENISAASLDKNRELGVLLADPDALARLAATFAQDWAS
jgi:cardiolipin synthase